MRTEQFELHARIERRHWWFVARRAILRRLADEALRERLRDVATRPTAIDIGCGTGANIAAFADRYRAIGIDTSPEAIAPAKLRTPTSVSSTATRPTTWATTYATPTW
ncbi:MAG: class I SAM-dependent methyltransferase [Pirellulales bacterium]